MLLCLFSWCLSCCVAFSILVIAFLLLLFSVFYSNASSLLFLLVCRSLCSLSMFVGVLFLMCLFFLACILFVVACVLSVSLSVEFGVWNLEF